MNIHEIRVTMQSSSCLEKLDLLSHLEDVFDSYSADIENFIPAVELLIQWAITPEEEMITEAVLRAISEAANKDVSQIDFPL